MLSHVHKIKKYLNLICINLILVNIIQISAMQNIVWKVRCATDEVMRACVWGLQRTKINLDRYRNIPTVYHLMEAAGDGDLKEIERLVKAGIPADSRRPDDWFFWFLGGSRCSATEWAANACEYKAVILLLRLGAKLPENIPFFPQLGREIQDHDLVLDLSTRRDRCKLLANMIFAGGSIELARIINDYTNNECFSDEDDTFPGQFLHQKMWSVLLKNRYEAMEKMQPYSDCKLLSVNVASDGGMRPLHLAAYKGCREMVQLLIRFGADINGRDALGGTALMWAVYANDKDTVEYLIKQKADVAAQDEFGNTALILANQWQHPEIAQLLIIHPQA